MKPSFSIPISRRDFMKLAGLTAAGVISGTSDMKKAAAAAPKIPGVDFSEADIPVLFEADVCVVGGGAAGTAAAVSAARKGVKTVLVERGIMLGGLQTMGCVYPCMPTFIDGSDTPYILDLNKRIEKHGVSPDPGIVTETSYGGGRSMYVSETLSLVYEEMCSEAGVSVLYDMALIGAIKDEDRITECVVQTVEGLGKIKAKTFIDATGDALLSRFSGVPSEKGSTGTGRNQPMSLRFEMSGIDIDKVFKFFSETLKDGRMDPQFVKKWKDDKAHGRPIYLEFAKIKENEDFFKKGVARGEVTEDDILYIQGFSIIGKPNTMALNCPEMPPLSYSSTNAISRSQAVSFGRSMMHRLADFFIKNIPGFEKGFISREAAMVGIRESWRIHGKYYMEAEDYWQAHHFPDAVCRTAYPIDIHDVKLDFGKKLTRGQYYEIPYRALVTNEISNLIVAGRCASGSFAAQASFRIQPTCMSMGEAAGIAAAWGLSHNIEANAIRWENIPKEQRSYSSNG